MLVDSPASFAFDELVNEHKFHLVTANDRQVALTFTTHNATFDGCSTV